jgi:AraC-like DNA-binding protein
MAYRTEIATKKSTPPLLRNAHLMAFESLLRERGFPVDRCLRRHELPVMCDEPDAFLPLLRIWSFFDDAARHEDPQLGWLVGAHVGDHNLNANLLRKIETAPTLLAGMRRLVQMISVEATDLDIGIHGRRDDVLFYVHYPGMREVPGFMISQAYQLEIIVGLIRHFLGRRWVPDEIGIESALVTPIAEAHFPGCRILTQQTAGYIAVPRSCLHRTVPPGGAKVGSADNPLLSEKSPVLTSNFSYVDSLRAVLKSYLSEGYQCERVAAEFMNTSVRTLSRKLSSYDYTYGKLIDELRFNTAKEQLQNSDERIGDIAHNAGFDDQGDFSRMIRRLSGLTPSEFRKAARSKVEWDTTT